ncbi:MAG: cytochrome c biogenesis protein CcdA [Actinobacteria bacterium]|nr:cytochrome c biogenesis protein CcdA [Actinomycetota bacterium]
MPAENVTLPIAFAAGVASFLSPCVLSLVPTYLSYLVGRSLVEARGDQGLEQASLRRSMLSNALAFIVGFSVVFIASGAAAINIAALYREKRIEYRAGTSGTLSRGVLLLVVYSAGLGIPFFLAALSLTKFTGIFRRIAPHLPKVRFAAGLLMVGVGLMIYFNYFIRFSRILYWG